MMCYFLFQIWKQYFITTINPYALHKRGKIFCVTTYLETKTFKLYKQNFAGSLIEQLSPEKNKFIVGYTTFKPQGQYTTSTR